MIACLSDHGHHTFLASAQCCGASGRGSRPRRNDWGGVASKVASGRPFTYQSRYRAASAGAGLLEQIRLIRLLPRANSLSLPAKTAKSNALNRGASRGPPRLQRVPSASLRTFVTTRIAFACSALRDVSELPRQLTPAPAPFGGARSFCWSARPSQRARQAVFPRSVAVMLAAGAQVAGWGNRAP